jgi:hypothetical protein
VADVTLDVTMTNRYTRYGCRMPIRRAKKSKNKKLKGGMIEGITALQPSC